MNQLNSILLEGTLVEEPILKETLNGIQICNFTVASNRIYKTKWGTDETEISYIDVECWGRLAEICNINCKKERGVRIVGRIKQNKWQDDSGKEHSKLVIVAEHVEVKPIYEILDN